MTLIFVLVVNFFDGLELVQSINNTQTKLYNEKETETSIQKMLYSQYYNTS